jgi:hypothetical protein
MTKLRKIDNLAIVGGAARQVPRSQEKIEFIWALTLIHSLWGGRNKRGHFGTIRFFAIAVYCSDHPNAQFARFE